MFSSKLIGAILFIVGTSIGGGMLVMPVALAAVGMAHTIIFLVACWLVMTSGALLMLEVNLRLPQGCNLISMAKVTLGIPGQIIAWIVYLLLLYTLLSAYISGGGEVLSDLFTKIHFTLSSSYASIIFTLILGLVVYRGMRTVDYVNRTLMFAKLGVYVLLVCIISPHIQFAKLGGGAWQAITGSLMLLVTSFGFASIVPTLCDYLEKDAILLRKAILIGSAIPLLCYIIWMTVIMGVIPTSGPNGLLALKTTEYTISAMTASLNGSVKNIWINGFFNVFTSICMVTAFLGISIGLFDFLADGLAWRKHGIQGKALLGLTFLPPLLLVIFQPGLYLHAFNYAGICCVILLLILPILMAWQIKDNVCLKIPGWRIILSFLMIIAIVLLWQAMKDGFNLS